MPSSHDEQEQQEPVQQQVDERPSSSGHKHDIAVLEDQGVGEPLDANMQETSSPLQPERTAQTSPTPATPSAARVQPGSVTIDMSEAMPKPPAYDHGGASPASRQDSGHRSSIHFQPPNADRQLPPPSGATPPQSQSGYRRPFLEEDELPEYMTLSGVGPPFKIPASQSTTYTVTPSQGPVEFQQQPHQQPHQQPSVPVLQPPANARPPRTRAQRPISSVHTTPGAIGQHEGSHRQHGGAWTLEYWVDDTITYLCYLMDPKLSATTALVPRDLADNVRSSQNRVSSLAEVAQPAAQTLQSSLSNISRTVSTPPPREQQQQQQQGRQLSQQSSNISPDQPRSGHFEAGGSNVGRVDVTIHDHTEQGNNSLSNDSSEHSGLERVPTGHIRGRPPPLNRSRNAATLTFMSAGQADDDDTMTVGVGRHRGMGAVVIRVPRADPAVGSPTSEPASDPTATIQVDTLDPTPELSGETGSAEVQPVESADTLANPSDERVSTERDFGSLPPVHHVRINDGYPGEEADTMLAHAMDLQTGEGDRTLPSVHSNAFNNALTTEFFKSPTFAFVSAEDPQTWIWWSSHHESNLQRCRQEGPHEEVMMWWRTRIDFNSKESKARRRREKLRRMQQGIALDAPLGVRGRWQRFLSLQSSTPHQESMEITMRVRGLYYSWREETPELGYVSQTAHEQPQPGSQSGTVRSNGEIPLSEFSPQTWVNSDKMRLFTLVRDDSLVMGQRVKGGPVAEMWIHEGGALEAQDPIGDTLVTIPAYQSVMAPPLGDSSEGNAGGEFGAGVSITGAGSGATEGNEPASFIRSGSSSVISNNGTTANTFMTDVSAFTGGPVRSTIASTFNHPAASDRPSSAPSLVGRESVSSSSTRPPGSVAGSSSDDSRFTSSFPSKLRHRKCVIRVMQGLNPEVETFALSTGPRLPELFDLYTDQSLPGPSRRAFVCALTTFGTLVVIAFTSIAFVSR